MTCFCAREIFSSKKKKKAWNCFDKLILQYYSFVAKLSWKKNFVFEKTFVFFTKYTWFAEKNVFIWKKSFILRTFYREKNIYEHVKNIYLIWGILFYTENVCVTNKIQIFLKYIFILQKKFFDHKNIYLLKFCGEINNLVLKVSEAPNLWYSLK